MPGAGKGDSPRPVNLTTFRDNYDSINWKSKKGTKTMDQVEIAERLATAAHEGQDRTMGEDAGRPYIIHPRRVAVAMLKESRTYQAAAWLHAVLEYTSLTSEDLIKQGVSIDIVQIVECLTHLPDESYVSYLKRILSDPIARAVKRADLMDNLSNLPKGDHRQDKYELALYILDNV